MVQKEFEIRDGILVIEELEMICYALRIHYLLREDGVYT